MRGVDDCSRRTKKAWLLTRHLDEVGPAERYGLATEQIIRAEEVGFDSAWVAQHHFPQRGSVFDRHLATVRDALAGKPLGREDTLYPPAQHLIDRIWQATFSAGGGIRAGKAGDGLMLSRTKPRTKEAPHASLGDLQHPIVDAYLVALRPCCEPRILGSRTLFVADNRDEVLGFADIGLRRIVDHFITLGHIVSGRSLEELIATFDVHIGTPDDVIASLRLDSTLERVTDLVFQVHSVDPPHAYILRSLDLIASKVAALGWEPPERGTNKPHPLAH